MASITYIKETRQRPSDMQRVMNYCMQEKKTWDEETGIRWVSGVNCDGLNAITEFEAAKAAWSKDTGIRFYQYVQSFSPEEKVTYQQAHELALEFAAKAWPGHEVLAATHCDTAHIHSHFVINSVSFETGLKLRQHPNTLVELRKLSDELCKAYGLTTLTPYEKGGTKINPREYRAAVGGESWKFQLMFHIGEAMKRSPDKESFVKEMKKRGYSVAWTEERKYITYTCPNGKKCRGIKLHDDKYKKEMMEYEFAIRKQKAEEFIADGTGRAQCGSFGDKREDTLSAGGVRYPEGMAGEGEPAAGRGGAVPAEAISDDREAGHHTRVERDELSSDKSGGTEWHRHKEDGGTVDRTGWEEERGILFGLIQEAIRKSAGSEERQRESGKNLSQMGSYSSGSVGSVFDAGLRTLSAIGRLTEDADEDEEERRKRIEAQEGGQAVGAALGIAIASLLAIRDEEQRKEEEAAMQEELYDEQESIWQLSM